MPHVLRLVGRRIGGGGGNASALGLLLAAALAVIALPPSGSLEVSEQHHVEHPKTGQQSDEEQRSVADKRP